MPTMLAATENSTIVIRDIAGGAEMHAVEELQKEVWGLPDLDVVPLTQLVAAKAAGGVLLGAFEGETLIGFAYGFVSYEHGTVAHHSHMLAVKPVYRNFNLGHRLKLAQRERVLAQGINVMTWTFDPLQSLNAHFNFNKLGVISDRYFINFYGDDAASFLLRNGTDRLWVTWLLTSRRVHERLAQAHVKLEFERAVPLVQLGVDDSPRRSNLDEGLSHEQAVIEIPTDINDLERRSSELAFAWREATRWAFTEAIAAGYLVVDFSRQSRGDQRFGVYLLSRGKRLGDFG
ncbi:MAG: GNAT family N-acetyltransferase [Acidobacteriota bacterium]|nr:GNAT family N-acetyltransferase [Acidobacteriota bacterium]